MTDLSGKVAVVIGCSAPQGSGWAIAKALAAAGAKLIVAARRLNNLERLAAETGGHAVTCDVAVEADVAAVARFATERFGAIDVAVNAAGYSCATTIADAPRESFQRTLDVNYFGTLHVIRHMAEAMRGGGSIVVMSSLSATHPMLPLAGYAASKAAVDCLIRHAALEYGPRRIRINAILPGPIQSEMTETMLDETSIAALCAEIPLGRIGEPADFADAVLWLAGNAFVTGLSLPVSGGMQLQRFPTPNEMIGQLARR